MSNSDLKCVMIVDDSLPIGLIANATAVMGITIGASKPDIVGEAITDKSGHLHAGIVEFPVPVLKASPDILRLRREELFGPEYADVSVVDFFDVAQRCKTYDEYIEKMKMTEESALNYMGLGVCGPKKKVNRLAGSLPLLR